MFRPFLADDGAIIRLRVPGGHISVSMLTEIIAIADDFGAPMVQLTNRGNLQLRALADPLPGDLLERLQRTGLLPSPDHERVRNILAAPLNQGLGSTVRELDAAICSDPALAALPGRFLWAVSDASGAVLGEAWDLALQVLDDERSLVLAGDHAIEVPRAKAVHAIIARARAFLTDRDVATIWNVRDLPSNASVFAGMHPHLASAAPALEPGPIGGDLVVGVPLGFLQTTHVQALAAVASRVTITPWRSMLIEGAADAAAELQARGFTVTAQSPWARLSACVGAPSCRRTISPTLELARSVAPLMAAAGPRVHVVGCDRACGQPASPHLSIVAPTTVQHLLEAMASA